MQLGAKTERNQVIKRSDWPREGVNQAKFEFRPNLVNLPFTDHRNVSRCKKAEKVECRFTRYRNFRNLGQNFR